MRERDALILTVGSFVMLGLEWGLSGLFGLGSGGGFRRYTLHPAALVNPLGHARLLPSWPVSEGQQEGFAYLGLGLLVLTALALVRTLRNSDLRVRAVRSLARPEHHPLVLLLIGLTLFAFGAKWLVWLEVAVLYALLLAVFIRYPPKVLERLNRFVPPPLPLVLFLLLLALFLTAATPQIMSAFRAPGRFVWPVVYGLELLVIVFVCRRFRPPVAALLLVGALALQLLDLKIDQRYQVGQTTFQAHLQSDAWPRVIQPYDTLALIPPFQTSLAAPDDYLEFAYLAAKLGKGVTTGILARAPDTYPEVRDALRQEALFGPRDPRTLYIFATDRYTQTLRERMAPGLQCTNLDAYTLCSVRTRTEHP